MFLRKACKELMRMALGPGSTLTQELHQYALRDIAAHVIPPPPRRLLASYNEDDDHGGCYCIVETDDGIVKPLESTEGRKQCWIICIGPRDIVVGNQKEILVFDARTGELDNFFDLPGLSPNCCCCDQRSRRFAYILDGILHVMYVDDPRALKGIKIGAKDTTYDSGLTFLGSDCVVTTLPGKDDYCLYDIGRDNQLTGPRVISVFPNTTIYNVYAESGSAVAVHDRKSPELKFVLDSSFLPSTCLSLRQGTSVYSTTETGGASICMKKKVNGMLKLYRLCRDGMLQLVAEGPRTLKNFAWCDNYMYEEDSVFDYVSQERVGRLPKGVTYPHCI